MNDKRTLLVLTFALIISIAVSVLVSYKRINMEKSNNIVELTVDYSDIERLSSVSGIQVDRILSGMKGAGVTSVALTEDLASVADINLLSGIDPKKTDLYIPSKGLAAFKVKAIKSAGLRIIPRIRNSFDLSRELIREKISKISSYDTVIFAEEEVLGYPSYLREAAKELLKGHIRYGFVEFGKQLGDVPLASLMAKDIIKVHSIPQDEMEGLTGAEMLQRYLRAARERGVRMLYVHLLPYPENGKDLLKTNIDFIAGIKKELVSSGFIMGKASIPGSVKVSNVERSLLGLGIASASVMLLSYFMPINLLIVILILAVSVFVPLKLMALASAIVFPSYAVIAVFPAKREEIMAGVISKSVLSAMYVAGITMVGAMLIASLLSDKVHMLGVDAFIGVKIALVLPVALVAIYFFMRGEMDDKLNIKSAITKARDLMSINIKVSHAVLFLFAALCGALLILRSGNFGMPVSGSEKHLRGLLENILFIRPRTKEFLIGYPAMILGAMYYLKGGNRWLWFWLALGVLAPISMLNSFCHIHTPLMVSLVRSCIGLIIGIALGLLLYLAYMIWNRIWEAADTLIK